MTTLISATQVPDFHDLAAPAPDYDEVAQRYQALHEALDAAADTAARVEVIRRWDALQRELGTWQALTSLRFSQDTRDPDAKRARDLLDELQPRLTDLAVELQKTLLAHPDRPALEAALSPQAFRLWEMDVTTFDKAIEADLTAESKLSARYIELLASARFDLRGETLNLSSIARFTTDKDRQTRYDANALRWAFFAENRAELDQIFGDLVRLRHGMAKTLGDESFLDLGYRRMQRIDYGRAEVERFRQEVREVVVPLCQEIRADQARRLGVSPLMSWDEAVLDPEGNPKPRGDHDWMLEQAHEMFRGLGPELAAFFRLMTEKHLLDLKAREGKAGGGFCTTFPTSGAPFIFANFNGTKGDVRVFTHEAGHAFQCWSSRDMPLLDLVWPSMEACEIHSMSLEFLSWPYMDLFFGDEADRFRRQHLAESVLFLPYGVAVDHFQHEVYARPDASPDERRAMWQEMERTYLPWRNYGDLPHVRDGGLWQHQRHIYRSPFYYIDYTLALTCALQLWLRGEENPVEAMEAYVALCKRGGEAPFQALAASAGLTSPFEPGCLRAVTDRARTTLGL